MSDAPYDPHRAGLYTADELFSAFDPGDPCSYCATYDARVYRHWADTGGAHPSPEEAARRRLHDGQITDALGRWLEGKRVVAVMGGHEMERGPEAYTDVARLARAFARSGYTVATGGGPGAMEAAHLGAALAEHDDDALGAAVEVLRRARSYTDEGWLAQAVRAGAEIVGDRELAVPSVGIPTWHYGHEPPTPFASVIAKYFENSIREDGLLSIASHGIVFAPGSAGTIQEIFQDAAQNHYGTVRGVSSPMVLMGVAFWTERHPVLPVLQSLSAGRPYASLITALDDVDEIVAFVADHPPLPNASASWSFCAAFCGEQVH